jgi:hypothetical protein
MARTYRVKSGGANSGFEWDSLKGAFDAAVSAYTSPVADVQPWIFECEAFEDVYNSRFDMDADSSETNNITIRPATGHERVGLDETTAYRYRATGVFDRFDANSAYMKIEGISFCLQAANASLLVIKNNITLRKLYFYSSEVGISTNSNGDGLTVENCVIVSSNNYRINVSQSCSATKILNNTLINTSSGGGALYYDSDFAVDNLARNNVCIADVPIATEDGVPGTVFDAASSNNASSDTSASTYGIGTVTGVVTTTGTDFTDYANGDYTPASGGALDGAGTDLSVFFTDDITGATRT